MTLEVQKFLETNTFAQLRAEHGVKYRLSDCGRKASLNYDQIEAHDANKIAQQCRGLILARVGHKPFPKDDQHVIGETIVMARPFDRFFNVGQDAAAKINFDAADTRFYEKADGTLTIVYRDAYQKRWHVATRAVCEADLPVSGYEDYTFRKLFERALENETGYSDLDEFGDLFLDISLTYMFELCTPVNVVVVKHKNYNLHLLGVRGTWTGKEYDIKDFKSVGIPLITSYKFGSLTDMVDFVSDRDPSDYEGIVACDAQFRRVKCKNAGYMALGRVKDSVMKSPRGLMQLILMEKLDDVIPLLPEFALDRAHKLQDAFRDLNREFMNVYAECLAVADEESPIFNPGSKSLVKQHRKSFAIAVDAHPKGWMAPMIQIYQGRADSFVDWVKSKQNVDGTWSNGFLDTLMREIEKQ